MSYSIYTGRWTDWSKGPILGDQVTLSSNSTNTLVAFIAIFITVVGGVTWSILAYFIHQARVTHQDANGLHYQTQALLRSGFAPTTFTYRLLRVGLAWRHRLSYKQIIPSTLGLVILAILVYASFIAAGLLLALVATTGDVLMHNTRCGFINGSNVYNSSSEFLYDFLSSLNVEGRETIEQALNYAQVCYPTVDYRGSAIQSSLGSTVDCNFYTKSSLNWTTSFPGICPFNDGICIEPLPTNVVRFDTGYLDTRTDLGRNTHKNDSLQFRKVTTCAPVTTEGFTTGFINDAVLGHVAVLDYGVNEVQPLLTPEWNTYDHTFVYSYDSYVAHDVGYSLSYASTGVRSTVAPGRLFFPNERLISADFSADVELFFLANRAYYPEPVTDPWYNATTELAATDPIAGNQTWYYNSQPASVLGCAYEIELCNPSLPERDRCMMWTSMSDYVFDTKNTSVDPLRLNERQRFEATVIGDALYDSFMANIIGTIGADALASSKYSWALGTAPSLPLPSNQWLVDLQNLQAISMAMLQRSPITVVTGPSDPNLIDLIVPANTPPSKWGCGVQKIRSADYSSFSVLGLCLIFGLGGLVILMGTAITFIVPAIQRRHGLREHGRRQWYAMDLLRLERIAFEDRGLGRWSGRFDDDNDDVPVTMGDEKFPLFTSVPARPLSPSSDNVPEHSGPSQSSAFTLTIPTSNGGSATPPSATGLGGKWRNLWSSSKGNVNVVTEEKLIVGRHGR